MVKQFFRRAIVCALVPAMASGDVSGYRGVGGSATRGVHFLADTPARRHADTESFFPSQALGLREYSPLNGPQVRFEVVRMLALTIKVSLKRFSDQKPDVAEILLARKVERTRKTTIGPFYIRWRHRLAAWFYTQLELALNPEKRLAHLLDELRALIASDQKAGIHVPQELVDFVKSPGEAGREVVGILHFWAAALAYQVAVGLFSSTLGTINFIVAGNWVAAAGWAIPDLILFGASILFVWHEKGRPIYPRILLPFLMLTPIVSLLAPLLYMAYVLPELGLLIFFARIRAHVRNLPLKKLPGTGRVTELESAFAWVLRLIFLDNIPATAALICGLYIRVLNYRAILDLRQWKAVAGMIGLYAITVAWNILIPNSWTVPKKDRMRIPLRILTALPISAIGLFLTIYDYRHLESVWQMSRLINSGSHVAQSLFFLGAAIAIGVPLMPVQRKAFAGAACPDGPRFTLSPFFTPPSLQSSDHKPRIAMPI